jgi:RNA polymerase sigma-70 factor (ECF subfamily)
MVDHPQVPEFIRLLTSHEVRLRAFAFSLIPHWADAEEVLQDAHLVMWKKFDQFTLGTSFYSWACRIIHLTAKDFRKRSGRSKIVFCDEFLDHVAAQSVTLEDTLVERERLLTGCIEKLKAKHQQMLHLRYQQAQTVEQVATAQGSTVKAIYQALSRVHRMLHDCVERRLAGAAAVGGGPS